MAAAMITSLRRLVNLEETSLDHQAGEEILAVLEAVGIDREWVMGVDRAKVDDAHRRYGW